VTKRDEWLRFAGLTITGTVLGTASLLEPLDHWVDSAFRLLAAILLLLAAQNFPQSERER
jgi:hypothetical protein